MINEINIKVGSKVFISGYDFNKKGEVVEIARQDRYDCERKKIITNTRYCIEYTSKDFWGNETKKSSSWFHESDVYLLDS